MKDSKGITMVSLVVTIIILIILTGISLNVTIGEGGIITKAKQAKQNILLAGEAEAIQLNQLYYELETGGQITDDEESTIKDETIKRLNKQIEELQSQLNSLNAILTQTNSTTDKILSGYKAYSGGKLLTGTMPNREAVTSYLNCGQSYTIPTGYHNGSGKVTANSLASQTIATATSQDILTGKTAWVNGNLLTGTNSNSNQPTLLHWSAVGWANPASYTFQENYAYILVSYSGGRDVLDTSIKININAPKATQIINKSHVGTYSNSFQLCNVTYGYSDIQAGDSISFLGNASLVNVAFIIGIK